MSRKPCHAGRITQVESGLQGAAHRHHGRHRPSHHPCHRCRRARTEDAGAPPPQSSQGQRQINHLGTDGQPARGAPVPSAAHAPRAVSGHQDQRWQGAVGQDQAIRQPDASGVEDGSDELAAQRAARHWAFYRRLCSRMDKPRANTATAHKLARMPYFMLTRGEAFVDQGQQRYEQQQREESIATLKRRAAALGFQITQTPALASKPASSVLFLARANRGLLPAAEIRTPAIAALQPQTCPSPFT